MKSLFLLLFACAPIALFGQTTTTETTIINGVTRTYRLYIPGIYTQGTAVPVVFNFHGYGSNNVEQEAYGDFRPIADTANFILVHPQGLSVNGSTGWNNFGLPAQAQADIQFVEQIITEISNTYSINSNRIYSTGMSNGGFMSNDLACFLSHRFAAIASVTGGMTVLHKNACNPSHPVPMMQIHGTTDAVVPYTGGGTVGFLHVDSLVKFWRNFNQCDATPIFTAIPNLVTTDNCTAEHYVWKNGLQGSSVELYKIINGGHSWPGAIFPVNGNTNKDFKASTEIWRFFSQYSLQQLTAATTETTNDETISVYPNPTTNQFVITVENPANYHLRILDVTGKQVLFHEITEKKTVLNVNYPSGLYLYEIQFQGEKRKSGKITIN